MLCQARNIQASERRLRSGASPLSYILLFEGTSDDSGLHFCQYAKISTEKVDSAEASVIVSIHDFGEPDVM